MYEKYLVVLAVGAFIFDAKNRMLVVKKSLNEQVDGGLWTIPGGKIYPKEHILEGLRREVGEEVGLEISNIQWIGEDVFPVQDCMIHAEHFRCEATQSSVVLEAKLTDYKWISTITDINILPFPTNIKNRIIEIMTK